MSTKTDRLLPDGLLMRVPGSASHSSCARQPASARLRQQQGAVQARGGVGELLLARGHEGAQFISKASFGKYQTPYWAPYRSLYSRNITNPFMAGRDLSVTHEALGAVRVMRTCGTMGEIVGMAASLCKRHDCTPRAVY